MKFKKIYIISIVVFVYAFVAGAQVTVYTPNGTQIEMKSNSEHSQSKLNEINSTYINSYPLATFLSSASNRYNCHSYAWYMTPGGQGYYWMNQTKDNGSANLSHYWNDGSYIVATEANAEKIFYYSGDHSAIRSTVAGKYDSKWGQAPLMRHAPNYGPATYNMNYRRYYRRIYITGSTLAGLSGTTYTLNNVGNPGTVTWSCSSNLQIMSNSNSSAVVKSTANGKGWIRATVDGQLVKEYPVWSGKPVMSYIEGERFVTVGEYGDYRAVYDGLSSPTGFEWVLTPQRSNSVYANHTTCTIYFREEGFYTLKVRATNANGTGDYFDTYVEMYNTGIYSYMIYPNPASNVLMVNFDVKSSESGYEMMKINRNASFKIYLYDDNGSMVRQTTSDGSQIQFDVSNLPNGIYYLHIDDGRAEKPEVRKVIVKH